MTLGRSPVLGAVTTLALATSSLACAYGGPGDDGPDLGLEALVNDEPGVSTLPGGAMLVIHVASHAYGVLAVDVPESWGAGAIEPVELEVWSPSTVRQDVDPSALPTALRAREGLVVETYGGRGLACSARLGAPSLVRRVWTFDEDEARGVAPEARAEDLWERTERTLLVAELEPLAGACDDAVFASPRALPVPSVFVGTSELDARDAQRAALAFASRPIIREFEHDRLEVPAAYRPAPVEPSIVSWRDVVTGRTLLTATSYSGCDSNEAPSLDLVLDGDDPSSTILAEQPSAWLPPDLMLDLDADGSLDVIKDDGIFFDYGTEHEHSLSASPADPPCPC